MIGLLCNFWWTVFEILDVKVEFSKDIETISEGGSITMDEGEKEREEFLK